jgi:hypothetical protein
VTRFGINPGPLRVRGEIPRTDFNVWRCEAITAQGLRCIRPPDREVDGKCLCKQHAAIAERNR